MFELPRVAEIIRDSSPDVTGVDDSLPRLMDGAAGVVTDGVADGVTDGEAVETSGGITVLVEFETIIWPIATAAITTIEAIARVFHETLFRSVGILVTLFSTNIS